MTIDLANTLDKSCPLRTLEMAFQRMKISKLSEEKCPQTPLATRPFGGRVIPRLLKDISILHTQKVGSLSFVLTFFTPWF